MGEQDEKYMDTLSGNDLGDHGPDEPGQDTGDTDTSSEQPPGQDAGTDAGEPDTGHDTEDKDDKEVSDSADREQIITVIEDDAAKEWREDISSQLSELMKPDDDTEVTERLDELIMLLTPDETAEGTGLETYAEVSIPFDGYEGWIYPIRIQYQVYPYGAGHWMEASESFTDVSSFTVRYSDLVTLCQEGGTLKDFYLEYIWEDAGSDEQLVYDHEAQLPEPEPDPGEEETKETVTLLLSHLEGINTTLADMTQADLEYHQSVKDYQAEMLELNRINTACDITASVGVFCIFAVLLWSEFFRRFK